MNEPTLLRKLRETAAKYGMFAPGQTVVVAVSGGPDSVALLHALAGLREDWGLMLVAAHLDHGFRGAESAEDAAYVARLAQSLGLESRIESANVPEIRKRLHLSAQEAARQVRHDFLRRVAAEVGAERIALGHTRSDRIETILQNILRGAGTEGLGGFPAVNFPLVRPLYEVDRVETGAYCAAFALNPRQDSSNLKTDYQRNRIRAELLPHLRTYYNERVDETLVRMGEIVAADNELLEVVTAETLPKIALNWTETELVLDAQALRSQPLALQRRLLRLAVAQVRGHLQDIGFARIEKLLRAMAEGFSLQETLPAADSKNTRIVCDADTVRIMRVAAPASPLPWEIPLVVPGLTPLFPAGATVEAVLLSTAEKTRALSQESGAHAAPPAIRAACALFPLKAVTLPIVARSWHPGDRMRPRGLNGTKKLHDLFIDRKVPQAERMRVPILAEAGGAGRILMAGGLHCDETALSSTAPETDEAVLLLCIRADERAEE